MTTPRNPQAVAALRGCTALGFAMVIPLLGTFAATMGVLVASPAAAADGPGYGATAGEISARWDTPSQGNAKLATSSIYTVPGEEYSPWLKNPNGVTTTPSSDTSHQRTLTISAYGYKRASGVIVTVGSTRYPIRADESGSIIASLPQSVTPELEPGHTITAQGVTPAGGERNLVGSVPPYPNGTSPTVYAAGLVASLASLTVVTNMFLSQRRRQPEISASQISSSRKEQS